MSFRTARRRKAERNLTSTAVLRCKCPDGNGCSPMYSTLFSSVENSMNDRARSSPLLRRLLQLLVFVFASSAALTSQAATPPEQIIIDTDIGDDVDDAFAVALALRSPELQILGITTTFGDTETRAKLLDRFLGVTGHSDIPVASEDGSVNYNTITQRGFA